MSATSNLLHNFRPGQWWISSTMWGGGHTVETDPTKQGWRAKPASHDSEHTVLVGRPGIPGCFSAQLIPAFHFLGHKLEEAYIDVAIYLETPAEVVAAWKAGVFLDPSYHRVALCPGWALRALELVQLELQ